MHLQPKAPSSFPTIEQPQSARPLRPAMKRSYSDPAKSVHFPEILEDVRVFKRAAKPASLLSPSEPETDTDSPSEQETIMFSPSRWTPQRMMVAMTDHLVLESTQPIPRTNLDPSVNVVLESLSLSENPFLPLGDNPKSVPVSAKSLFLKGRVLLRNIAFEKYAMVRFSLDDWNTRSEVSARFQSSLTSSSPYAASSLPPFLLAATSGEFDRFEFSINLSHFMHQKRVEHPLHKRTLSLAVRYQVPATKGEWWDNCDGNNYDIRFLKVKGRQRRQSESSPVTSPQPLKGRVMSGSGMGKGVHAHEAVRGPVGKNELLN